MAAAPDKPDGHQSCVDNVNSFTECFLFRSIEFTINILVYWSDNHSLWYNLVCLSLETQHTIGYGSRVPTENCGLAVVIMSVQSIVGVVIQACMAGIVFAKFTKPTNRAETILFR